MYCQKCNFQNEDIAKFCRNCGTELTVNPPTKRKKKVFPWVIGGCIAAITIVVCAMMWRSHIQSEACKNKELEVKMYYDKGQDALKDELYDLALTYYTKSIEIDSTFAEGYVGMAECHANQFKDKYEYQMTTPISKLPTYADFVKANQTHYDAASKYCQKALYFNPNLAEAYVILSNISFYCRNTTQVTKYAQKAIEINPNNSKTNLCMGICMGLSEHRDSNKAIEYLKKAIEIDPNNSEAYYYMGLQYIVRNDVKQGTENLTKAKQLGYKPATYMLKELVKHN